jgi:hypothetical protein
VQRARILEIIAKVNNGGVFDQSDNSEFEHRHIHNFSLSNQPTLCAVKVFGIISLFKAIVAVDSGFTIGTRICWSFVIVDLVALNLVLVNHRDTRIKIPIVAQ